MASKKQRAWLEYYFMCWNATEAARLAKYKWPNSRGPENLIALQSEINARLDTMAMPANEVLVRLGQHAEANIADFITDTGAIDWRAVRAKGHLVKKVMHRKGQQSVIELHDSQVALIHLDKVHGGPAGGAIPVPVTLTEVIVRLPDESMDAE